MPLISRKRVLAAKLETTVWAAEAIGVGDATFQAFDAEIQATVESIDRQSQGSFGYLPATVGLQSGTCTFRLELIGDGLGGIPAWGSIFLPACGWMRTTAPNQVFKPKTLVPSAPGDDLVSTISIGVYVDGTLKLLRGCMGSFVINMEAGKPASISFTFMGAYSAESPLGLTDTTLVTPTYGTAMPYRFANTSMSVGGMSPCVQSLTIDSGNEVTLLPCQTNVDGSGYKGGFIGNRRPTITMNPEAELVATDTFMADLQGSTQRAFQVVLTDAAGSVTIDAPKVQPISLQHGDRDGLVTDEVTFLCGKSVPAGDDELTITFA